MENILYTKEQIKSLNNDIKNHFKNLYLIEDKDHMTFDGVSRMVMLDRYSQKDPDLSTLKAGDVVLTTIKEDPTFPTRGIGKVISVHDNEVLVQLEDQYVGQIDPELLTDKAVKDIVTKDKFTVEKPLELFFEQIARRVGHALAQVEKTPEEKKEMTKEFTKQLTALNIVPAGRVLYGAGSKSDVTFFNCYVMPMIPDDREGISKHRAKITEIMARGGGVGTNGSTLRPKGTIAKSVGGRTSGAVSWLNDQANLTNLIEQGGSRRGAQMIMLDDWHPDIIEFIVAKMQNPSILLWLRENSPSELIRQAANDKLTFEYLSDSERKMYQAIVDHKNDFDEHTVKKAEKQLKDGGNWKVVKPDFLSGANISVAISNPFMEAVEKNEYWDLKFPDLENMTKDQKDYYDKEWSNIGSVFEWEKMGLPVKVYHTIKARDLWDLINFCATYSAEPGVFFLDRANDMTNAQGYGQKVVATNPCGEQPLAPWSVCNLGAINLANFVNKDTHEILYKKLEETVKTAIKLQDDVIDATPYFLPENKKQALGERRIGLGVMGLHDMLIFANLKYGSKEGNKVVDRVFETIATTAYRQSIELAKTRGSFPFLKDRKKFIKSGYLQNMPEDIRDGILKYGIRNSHLLTVAPTGSTGTMVGGSTGLEPYFAFTYFRSGRLGKFMEVKANIVKEWLAHNPDWDESKGLPDFFVSAMDLSPEEHADVQCTIQRWVDSSISKTVNAPKGYRVDQVEDIYMRLFKGGAKGGTVYVDGSRDTQVLNLDKDLIKHDEDEQEFDGSTKEQKESKNVDEEVIGVEAGNTCPICTQGTVIVSGGCSTCNNCGAQLKCGL